MENDKVVFSVKCVILEKEVGAGSGDFAVTIKQLWSIEKNAPEGVTDNVWDAFKKGMMKVDKEELLIDVSLVIMIGAIVCGAAFAVATVVELISLAGTEFLYLMAGA
jgi:hypothetical protein